MGAASSNPAARWSVLHGVVDQVGQDLLQAVGDHATNIAEMVIFMVKGRSIRHLDRPPRDL